MKGTRRATAELHDLLANMAGSMVHRGPLRGWERLLIAAQRLEHSSSCYYTGSIVAARTVQPPLGLHGRGADGDHS